MINSIVAVERSQGIGFQGSMPWPYLKTDMMWFKKLTTDQIVIMGANTWRSLPKKLSNRLNYVITRYRIEQADHCFSAIEAAMFHAQHTYPDKEIFIIGGQQLYDSTMDSIDRFFITEIDADFTCDKFFNYNYVKAKYPQVIEHSSYADPITHTMKEYTK